MMEITGDINDTQDSGAKLYIGDYAIADSNGDLVESAGRGSIASANPVKITEL
jgi:hypothetical protein